jgi:hypothetical protein
MLRKKTAALSIDNTLTDKLQDEIKSGKYTLDEGVPLPLSKTDKSKIIYRKYEAESDMITDTRHKEWHETLVAHPKVAILGLEDRLLDDDISGISTDDGIIMTFEGEPLQTVCIDSRTMRVLTEQQAELEEEATGQQFVRYTEWGFRLADAKLTNGPEARQRLSETYERQKNQEQAEMFSSMESFFTKLMTRLESDGKVVNSPENLAKNSDIITDPKIVMQELLQTHSPEQLKAMVELEEAENDVVEPLSKEEIKEAKAEKKALDKLVESGEVEELKK